MKKKKRNYGLMIYLNEDEHKAIQKLGIDEPLGRTARVLIANQLRAMGVLDKPR